MVARSTPFRSFLLVACLGAMVLSPSSTFAAGEGSNAEPIVVLSLDKSSATKPLVSKVIDV